MTRRIGRWMAVATLAVLWCVAPALAQTPPKAPCTTKPSVSMLPPMSALPPSTSNP